METNRQVEISGTYFRTNSMLAPDKGYVVLFLRPSGRFPFVAEWKWYEHGTVTGTWVVDESRVQLTGWGSSKTDVIGSREPRDPRFQMEMVLEGTGPGARLAAVHGCSGFGMLGMKDSCEYLGRDVVVAPHGARMADSVEEIDESLG